MPRLFARPAPPPGEPAPTPRAPLRVLRADGQRIDLTKRDSAKRLTATKQGWQSDAYDYRDQIGELRYAVRLLARSVARVRFYPAATRPWPADPAPLADDDHDLDKQLAANAVTNFDRIPLDSNPDGFTARLVENLALAGEAWPHLDANDRWWVRSVSEISASPDGRVMLASAPGAPTNMARAIDPEQEDLLRIWVPHPQWGQVADSPMRSLLDVAEDVVLAGKEQRAAARSRLAANGVLFIPDTMTLVKARGDEDDLSSDSIASDTFFADFEAAVVAPVNDDGAPQMVVPIVIRGDREDIASVKHIRFDRADSEQLIARQGAAILRLLKGLDIQPEQVEGLDGMSHWSAWLIEAQSVRHQVQPMAETVAHGLAAAYLRPALLTLGHSEEEVSKVTIGVDVSPLTDNPNRGQDARDAHAANVISDEALRRELGFDDDDKPSDEEVVRRMAINGRLPVEVSAAILGLARDRPREQITVPGQVVPTGLPAGESDRPAAQPGQLHPDRATPAQPTQEQPPGPVVAAATPDLDDWIVNEHAARRLADIDAALTERVLVAADAALQRVVERAGARVRTAARNDTTLTASITGVEAHLIPAKLGREKVESFVAVTDLIADGYARLRGQVEGWLADAAEQAADTVCAVLGLDPKRGRGRDVRAAVRSRLTAHRDRAWPVLVAALDAAAEDALFPLPDPLDEPGERADTLIDPLDVADALAAAGGDATAAITAAGGYGGRGRTGRSRRKRRDPRPTNPAAATPTGGVATGPIVHGVIAEQGGILLGWEWQYRPEVLRSTFDPHKQLDGQRFLSWRDPILATGPATAWIGTHFHPRDHTGCFIAGTEVSGPPAYASFVRPYKGEGVEIRTQSGKLLTGTPNHPILTPRGWVPMGELREGDEVVVAGGDQRALEVDDEAHQMPALIEDVAAALPMTDSVVARPVPTSAEDFHGDGAASDGQVTVVRADSRLLTDFQPARAQFGRNDVLLLGGGAQRSLSANGVSQSLLPRHGLAPHGSVGGEGDSLPLLGRGVVVPSEASLASIAGGHSVLDKRPTDDRAGEPMLTSKTQLARSVDVGVHDVGCDVASESDADRARPAAPLSSSSAVGIQPPSPIRLAVGALLGSGGFDETAYWDAALGDEGANRRCAEPEALSDGGNTEAVPVGGDHGRAVGAADDIGSYPLPTSESLDRFAGGAVAEQVVQVERVALDCHVYNLSTTTEWYVANGVIVHNCRCTGAALWAAPADHDSLLAQALRDAHGDPDAVLIGGTPRTGTGNAADLRDRARAAVDAMRTTHIGTRRRGRR